MFLNLRLKFGTAYYVLLVTEAQRFNTDRKSKMGHEYWGLRFVRVHLILIPSQQCV